MWCIFGTYAPERNKLPPPPPSPRTMQRTFSYGYEYKPNPAQKWWQFWKQGFVQMRFEMNPHGSGTATGQGASMKASKKQSKPQARGRSLHPIVGQFISSECLGNFYVNSPSGEIIAMTPRRKIAQALADAMNRSRGRTAKLMRQGWSVGRDEMLYPPNPTGHAPARSAAEGR